MPEVQPVETTVAGPDARKSTASSVAPPLGTRAWCRKREAEGGSPSQRVPASLTATYSFSSRMVAPTALPRVTPTRSGSGASSAPPDPKVSPLSATASSAATMAICTKRSLRNTSWALRPSFRPSKSTSAATWDRNRLGSKKVIRRVAVRPAVIMSQKPSRPIEPGATTPIQVTTTRRRSVLTARLRGRSGPRSPALPAMRAPASSSWQSSGAGRARLGLRVDVAEFRPRGQRTAEEDEDRRLGGVVDDAVPDADRDVHGGFGGQPTLLTVEPHDDLAALAVEELLRVRVPVLGHDLSRLGGQRAEEAGVGSHTAGESSTRMSPPRRRL